MITDDHISIYESWKQDWCKYAAEVLKVNLDPQQEKILRSVQENRMTSVCSGTARGKDFVTAVAAVCFMYLTPDFNEKGELIGNTKIALTAPTDRQVGNIMYPEVTRLWKRAAVLPGRLVGYDIRTEWDEWFLTGFKASKDNEEAWTGFHAVNTMFAVTEASGLHEQIYGAIEGNLQGNSRLLLAFNPNVSTGYAAASQKSRRFAKFRLDSLDSPNVKSKEVQIPGQVDYEWVKDKVESWCTEVDADGVKMDEGDFEFEDKWYHPNDLFRVKVRGMFPKVSADTLIPQFWIEQANENWWETQDNPNSPEPLRIGVDVAGMGRDISVICPRRGLYVSTLECFSGTGATAHMSLAGIVGNKLKNNHMSKAYIDTIGEGAGVYSRLRELDMDSAISCKFSEGAKDLTDYTGEYEFLNMRAHLFWAVRDWLNPALNPGACLPPDDELMQEATEIKWKFRSDGKIQIEAKADIKKRLGRSTDKFDALANTFYPRDYDDGSVAEGYEAAQRFFG